MSARLVAIGAVMGAHGVRGALRVKVYNTESVLLASLRKLVVRHAGADVERAVRSAQPAGRGWLVQLVGVDTVEAAKALHGAELYVPRDALPKLATGEFYFADLPGLQTQTPDGTVQGPVLEVREYPASSVLRVQLAAGIVEVPMNEPYLVRVDVAAGIVVIDHVEDLEVEPATR